MDPQSAAFLPRDELWRITAEMSRLQQTQSEHAERLSRVERRQDEDIGRTKSLWGSQSPFPGILAGTPQQRPVEQPQADAFSGFDDPTNLIGSLQLDAEDEPRRVGATSRANSVRFDETANQGHWTHPGRASLDLLPRSGSSLGSHPLIERTYSHKSDGRQSSAGQSVHSVASRANSLGIDTFNALGTADGQPINPGLFVLGTCPAIVRCWLNTNFKHDSLQHAAICTGSNVSLLSAHLVEDLGLKDQVQSNTDGVKRLNLKLYLPEATIRSPAVRLATVTAQIPSITVEFRIINDLGQNDRSIGVIIGSDLLRANSADIMFSTNLLMIYDDDHSKLSVPLIRPENEAVFSSLQTTAGTKQDVVPSHDVLQENGVGVLKGLQQQENDQPAAQTSAVPDNASAITTPLLSATADTHVSHGSDDIPASPISRGSPSIKPNSTQGSWTSRRRDSDKPVERTETGWGKSSNSYQRREQGIKVLRPLKSTVRSASSTQSVTLSSSQSRFFEDGKRRITANATASANGPASESSTMKKPVGSLASSSGNAKEGASASRGSSNGNASMTANATATANPVGGASAFSWLSK